MSRSRPKYGNTNEKRKALEGQLGIKPQKTATTPSAAEELNKLVTDSVGLLDEMQTLANKIKMNYENIDTVRKIKNPNQDEVGLLANLKEAVRRDKDALHQLKKHYKNGYDELKIHAEKNKLKLSELQSETIKQKLANLKSDQNELKALQTSIEQGPASEATSSAESDPPAASNDAAVAPAAPAVSVSPPKSQPAPPQRAGMFSQSAPAPARPNATYDYNSGTITEVLKEDVVESDKDRQALVADTLKKYVKSDEENIIGGLLSGSQSNASNPKQEVVRITAIKFDERPNDAIMVSRFPQVNYARTELVHVADSINPNKIMQTAMQEAGVKIKSEAIANKLFKAALKGGGAFEKALQENKIKLKKGTDINDIMAAFNNNYETNVCKDGVPSDAVLKVAIAMVEEQRARQGNDKIIIPRGNSYGPAYVAAFMLYSQIQGYEVKNKSEWQVEITPVAHDSVAATLATHAGTFGLDKKSASPQMNP